MAKSRAARDGNKLKRKNFRPRHIKVNHPVLMRNHTAKPFEARSTDYICIGFQGKNRVFVKDNHGTITKVNRKDVTPVEMDIKIAELFNESRQNSKIRDAQLAMPTSKIPDLGWQFDKDIQLVEPVTEQIHLTRTNPRKGTHSNSTTHGGNDTSAISRRNSYINCTYRSSRNTSSANPNS